MTDIVERLELEANARASRLAMCDRILKERRSDDTLGDLMIRAMEIAVAAEREACAQIVDPPKGKPTTAQGRLGKMVREGLAAAIRARTP